MQRTTLLLILFVAFAFVAFNDLPRIMSNGAPAASTGAPYEKNCATSGCHSDFSINSGNAELSVSIENGITQYETRKTYPITVSISNPGLVRFGFQVVVLKNSDNTNAGTIKLAETLRTQIIEGYGALSERKYITYTYQGTDAVSAGLGKWTFDWTASETNEGPVTFYAASIAANNDGTDSGDHSYTKQLMLEFHETALSVLPTLRPGEFYLEGQGALCVYNVSGEKVYSASSLKNILDLSDKPVGVYFIFLTRDGRTEYKKIIISR